MDLPVPMVTAEEMLQYTIENETQYTKGEARSPKPYFELIEESFSGEFDSVEFDFTGMHRDWGMANKGLYAYGVTEDGVICARKTLKRTHIEHIQAESIRKIRTEKKLVKDKLIIETDKEEIQILVNPTKLLYIVEMMEKIL